MSIKVSEKPNKVDVLLVCALICAPFIMYFADNFAKIEFFNIYFIYFFLFYSFSLFALSSILYFFLSNRSTPFILFFASISFFQFYFSDLKDLVEANNLLASFITSFFIGVLSLVIAYFSRWSNFRNFLFILLLINILISLVNVLLISYETYYNTESTVVSVDDISGHMHGIGDIDQDANIDQKRRRFRVNSAAYNNIATEKAIQNAGAVVPYANKSPNIFYILPDGLTSPRLLREYAGIEIDTAIGNLRANGFSTLEHSYSSYNMTHLSLAALFDMRLPVTDISEAYQYESQFYPRIREEKPALLRYLKSNNFKFVLFPPRWGGCPADPEYICLSPPIHDTPFLEVILNDYAISIMLSRSLLIKFTNRFLVTTLDMDDSGKTALYYMKELPHIWSDGGVFTLIHMLIPHTPFRNLDCSVIKNKKVDKQEAYKSSAMCAFKRIEELSKFIIKNFPNASIVVQSDHGVTSNENTNALFSDIPKSQVDTRMSNFTAVRGCDSDQAVKMKQASIVKFIVECPTGKLSTTEYDNRSFFGFYEDQPEFGRVYAVDKN